MATACRPEGWHSVTPRLVARDAGALVTFLKAAFAASGEYRPDGPSEIRIGDSIVMVGGAGVRAATGSFLYLYVEDADAVYARAVAAGAEVVEPHAIPIMATAGPRCAIRPAICGRLRPMSKMCRWAKSAAG